jgi:ParB-like chromosome segregation protein Spo0J
MASSADFQVQHVPIAEVRENPDNPRTISDVQFRRLVKSIKEFPQMLAIRPLVVDAGFVVLGGNMRLKACREAGLGTVPVVVADTLTPKQRREFVIKDNASYGAWDWDALANEWSELPLADWGVETPSFNVNEQSVDAEPAPLNEAVAEYTKKIKAPVYEPTRDKPDVHTLVNRERYDALVKEIEASSASEAEKQFLRLAATRHIVVDYQSVADYYAHSSADLQALFEASALVIIDFSQAIERGYVTLSQDVLASYLGEQDDD